MILRRGRGQVLLEFAISLFGLVAFLYVTVKTWGWMSAMLVQRQASFQQSRLSAGQSSNYQPVGYQRPALSLIGPTSLAGGPPGGWEPPIDIPTTSPCAAANALFAEAVELMEDATALFEQAKAQLEPLTIQLRGVEERIAQLQNVEIPAAQAVVDDLNAQIAAVDAQIAALGSQYCSTTCDEFGCSEWCDPRYYEAVAPLNAQRARLVQDLVPAENVLANKNSEMSQKVTERNQLRNALMAKTQQLLPLIEQARQMFEQGQDKLAEARAICGLS